MRTLRAFVGGFVICAGLSLAVGHAQTPILPAGPAVAKEADAFVIGYLQAASGWQQAASAACTQLDAWKTYQTVVANATKEIEAHVPGFTVDWTTGKLVAKK